MLRAEQRRFVRNDGVQHILSEPAAPHMMTRSKSVACVSTRDSAIFVIGVMAMIVAVLYASECADLSPPVTAIMQRAQKQADAQRFGALFNIIADKSTEPAVARSAKPARPNFAQLAKSGS